MGLNFRPSVKTIFVMISAIAAGYALHDFKKSDLRKAEMANQHLVLPGFSYEDVTQIRVWRAMGELVLTQSVHPIVETEKVWRIEKPLIDRAGAQESVNFYNSISNLSLKPAGVEGDIRWAEYGLDQPEAKLEIDYVESSKTKTLTLEFGTVRTIEGGFYVRRNSTNELLVSSVDWTPLLLILPQDLRDKVVVPVLGPISSVEMSEKKNTWSITFEKEWSLKSESGESQVPTNEAVQDFARALRDLRAERVLDPVAQKSAPSFTLKVKTTVPPQEVNVSFYEKGSTIYATVPDRPVVYEISKEMLASVRKTPAYFMNKKPESSNDKSH